MNIDLTPILSGRVESFALLFVRVTTFLLVTPLFGSRLVPVKIRIACGLVLAVCLLPLVPPLPLAGAASAFDATLRVGREIVLGLVLGIAGSAVAAGVQLAGHLLGLQMGLGIGNVIDPQSETQTPVTAEFYSMLFLLVFLTLDGHHVVLRAAMASLSAIPLGTFTPDGATVERAIRLSGDVLATALRVGAPVIAFLFVSSAALGIISRTVPTMNVFAVGFPVKIIGGLVVLLATVPSLRVAFEQLTRRLEHDVFALVGLL